MQKYKVHIIWAVVVVVALVGGIFYGKSSSTSTTATKGAAASSTRGAYAGRTSGGGFVSGQVISVDSNSVMISLANGNSQVVFYSSSTPITVIKPTVVSASALTAGTRVMVTGTSNSDGSLTATSIQAQTGSGFSGGGAAGGRPSGTQSGQ
jgi:hypothetical protein